jgi:hypothetical protein
MTPPLSRSQISLDHVVEEGLSELAKLGYLVKHPHAPALCVTGTRSLDNLRSEITELLAMATGGAE